MQWIGKKKKAMKKRIYSILIVITILFTGFLYHRLVYNFREYLYQEDRMVDSHSKSVYLTYNLPFKEKLFLKIKVSKTTVLNEVRFNNNLLELKELVVGSTKAYSFYIPEELITGDKNTVRLVFSEANPTGIDVRLHNRRKKISDNLAILFSQSYLFKTNKTYGGFAIAALVMFLIAFILKNIYANIFPFVVSVKIEKYIATSILPGNIALAFIYFVPLSLGYRFVMSERYFFTFQSICIGFTLAGVIIKNVRSLQIREHHTEVFSSIWQERFKRYYRWVKAKDFSDKCILLFIFLLIMCAFMLILEMEWLAEQFANIVYFILVIGVVIKSVKFIR